MLAVRTWVCAIVIGVSGVASADAGTQPPARVGEVRAVLERQVEAWNRGDLESFMEGYWRSGELTFFSGGSKMGGWDATLERYRQRYQKDGHAMGRLEFPALDVKLFGRDAALVRGEWLLKRDRESLSGLFTLVLQRVGGAWKIVHDHTSAAP